MPMLSEVIITASVLMIYLKKGMMSHLFIIKTNFKNIIPKNKITNNKLISLYNWFK